MCKYFLNHYLKILITDIILLVTIILQSVLSACEKNRVSLQILGSGGPELNDQRASSSYLIWLDRKAAILVDTGSGSSLNFERTRAKFEDIQAILFTHFHVDHSADFPAYVKASFFTPRDQDLLIYGPEGNDLMPSTTEFVQNLLGSTGAYRYLNKYISSDQANQYKINAFDVPLQTNQIYTYKLSDSLSIAAVAVHHGPLAAVAWRVNAVGCSITFSGDMSNRYQSLAGLVKDSDLLVAHNAIPESSKGVARNLHMPPSEIGKIAKTAKVKKLILSHRMLRTIGREQETKQKIKSLYDGPILFANDMDNFNL